MPLKMGAIGYVRSVSQISKSAFSSLPPHEERAEPAGTANAGNRGRFEFKVASPARLTRDRSAEDEEEPD